MIDNPPLFAQPYRALVIGASGGIGGALLNALKADPHCALATGVSRQDDGLDLCREDAVSHAAEKLRSEAAPFDLIMNAVGVLETSVAGPEKSFAELKPAAMEEAFRINTLGAALAFKHFAPLLVREGRTVFATLSARIGSIGDNRLGGWMSYRASKAALNQVIRCAAIEESRKNKLSIVIALHPGTIKTPLTEQYAKGHYTASADRAAENLLSVISGLQPSHTGGFFDYAGKPIEW